MNVPEELYYTSEHEWVAIKDNIATIGITDYAQGELGDIVFVELPDTGTGTTQMETFGTIEAVKAVSDLYAPLTGEVTEINTGLEEKPELINNDPYGAGWLMKVKLADDDEVNKLLSADDYRQQIANE